MNEQRRLPANEEAEAATLGGILIDNDAFYMVSGFLKPSHFHRLQNRLIYEAMMNLRDRNEPLDLLTVADELERQGKLADAGGHGYAINLVNAVPTSVNTEQYGRLVEAAAIRRQLIHAAGKMATLAYSEGLNIDSVLGQAESMLFDVSDARSGESVKHIKSIMMDLYDEVLARRDAGGRLAGLETGYKAIDNILRGLKPSRFYLVAGRPGMGKSALANGFALSLASRNIPVAMFNLEMGEQEIASRLTAMRARIDTRKIEEGDLTADEWDKFTHASGQLSQMPLFIDDTPKLTPVQLRAKARRLYAEHGIKAIFIDYIGLMDSDVDHHNDTSRVSHISRQLKMIAKELELPVVALAQLNRQVEQRQEKIPNLSDLRDSGSLEQDADAVMLVYRDEYYKPDTTERPNEADVIIPKNRGGAIGAATLYWHKKYTLFANMKTEEVNL